MTPRSARPGLRTLYAFALISYSVLVLPSAADPVSNVIIFGDSNADVGSQGPFRRPTNEGQMWGERLAGTLGFQSRHAREFRINEAGDGIDVIRTGGENYAVNGATALTYDCCISLERQVDFFVEDRGRFDGNEIVFTWITRNDITTALPDGLPYSAELYADAYLGQIERLKSLGAKNIVAFGAEVGLIPEQFALDNGTSPDLIARLRQETILAEAALWPGLRENDVFIIDMERLGRSIIEDPAKYGFTHTTDSYQQRGISDPPPSQSLPNDGNVFTLDGHYTTAMQSIIADFTLAQIRASDQLSSVMIQSSLGFRNSREALESLRQNRIDSGWLVFGAPFAGRSDQGGSGPLGPGVSETFAGLAFGAEYEFEDGIRIGNGLTASRSDGRFDSSLGEIESNSVLFEAFASHPITDAVSLEMHGAFGFTDLARIRRLASLGAVATGSADGSTDGRYMAAGVGLKGEWAYGAWTFGGRAGLTYDEMMIEGYAETDGPMALHYGDLRQQSLLGSVDARVAYGAASSSFRPFAQVSLMHDFLDEDLDVQVGPTADTIVSRTKDRGLSTGVGLEIGFDADLGAGFTASASIQASKWFGDDASATSSGFRVSLGKAF